MRNYTDDENIAIKKAEERGQDSMTGLYISRYYAKKENPGKVIVKVVGGYKAMTYDNYQVWRNQK